MYKKRGIVFLMLGILMISLISVVYAKEGGNEWSNSGNSVRASGSAETETSVKSDIGRGKESAGAELKAELEAVRKAKDKIEEKKSELREKFEENKDEIKREFKERIENNEEKIKRVIEFKEKIRKNKGEFRVEGKSVLINEMSGEQKEIIAGKINARTELNLTADDFGNGTSLRAILSNGRFADVKIMPDRAAAVALEKLRAKCEERNCSIELKEVGVGNNTRAAWVVETDKESRVFLIFKKRMIAKAEIDSETGEILRIKKPWWAFLAKEKHATRAEIEAEIEGNTTIRKIIICHIPPGNSEARRTITISERALKAHLAHGDFVGACEVEDEIGGGNNTNVTIPSSPGNETNMTLPPINESNFTIPGNNETNATIPPSNNTINNTEGNSS